jgi:Protein of unknown function (DUF2971)
MNTFEMIMKVQGRFQHHIMNSIVPKIKPIDFLFHYTTIETFLNITKTNELWLSHASYMNDPNEIKFGIDIILGILKRKSICEIVIRTLEKQKNIHEEFSLDLKRDLAFIFSLSEKKDQLSQWMQYADSGNGICLGFINKKLLSTFSPLIPLNKHMYFPVQYYSSDIQASSSNILDFEESIINYYKEIDEYAQKNNIENDQQFQMAVYEMTKLVASFIKNDFYEQESEWRFVLFAGRGENTISIKPAKMGVKMIYIMKFGDQKIMDLIDTIKIGPKHKNDMRISTALEIAIRQNQMRDRNIGFSEGIVNSNN